ncbi:hypothetical protein CYLTODRAFT_426627 [Cylindrobasidium torrendii FP15055 ss-10]|uniref:Family A G protein-coupled receptor-like protein n=1 Tax=Cylindrobasidium torrendii FP15055 ss-10 TaxID=1314674 RepID=A0A0D7AX86_9AGAR|nr:hypothetical protein CYLTODRAFT_426627 [Cylindrobasidium torrendii FP15055 ss-10]
MEAPGPPTQALLHDVGKDSLTRTAGLMVGSIFWTLYLVLFCWASILQIKRGLRTLPNALMFGVTLFLFASSTALWILNGRWFFLFQSTFYIDYPTLSFPDRLAMYGQRIVQSGLFVPLTVLWLMNMMVGDAVVIWRAWVLWRGEDARLRRLLYIPMFLLLVTFALSIVAINCKNEKPLLPRTSKVCKWGQAIPWGVSLLTNITTTALVALRTWLQRKSDGQQRRSRTERVLVLLTESGFIFCFVWLLQVIIFFDIPPTSDLRYLWVVAAHMGQQLSGIYPTIIFILVNSHRSISSYPTASSSSSSYDTDPSHELSTMRFEHGKIRAFSPYERTLPLSLSPYAGEFDDMDISRRKSKDREV